MLFLLTDPPQKCKLEKIHGTLIILRFVNLSFPQLKNFPFFIKTQNTTTLRQATGGKTLNIVLKKMLEPFLKIQEDIY